MVKKLLRVDGLGLESFAFTTVPIALMLTLWTVQLLRVPTVTTVKLSARVTHGPCLADRLCHWAYLVC